MTVSINSPEPPSVAADTTHSERPNTASPFRLPWKILGQTTGFPNEDQELWWSNTAPLFNELLAECDYDAQLQYQYVLFFRHHVIPVLGPFFSSGATPNFASRLSKHGHPLDFSVNFQKSGATVRMSFAAIGSFAGLQRDPLNQFRAREVLDRLAILYPNVDLQLFRHFEAEFSINAADAQKVASKLPKLDWGTKMMAIDMLKNGSMTFKVYYMCRAKAAASGLPVSTIIFNAIQRLGSAFEPGVSLLRQFLPPLCETGKADLGLLSFDCVATEFSRIKVYVINQFGSLESIRDLWTLGGALEDQTIMKGLEVLEHVCELIQFRWSDDSRYQPILFNYEIKKGSVPKPQIYLPLADRNDQYDVAKLKEVFQDLEWKRVPFYQDTGKQLAPVL
ncbi:aromatic prenyltransferase [Aspergillus floccosus]